MKHERGPRYRKGFTPKFGDEVWDWCKAYAHKVHDALQLPEGPNKFPVYVAILTSVVDGYCTAAGLPLPELKFTLEPEEKPGAEGGGT